MTANRWPCAILEFRWPDFCVEPKQRIKGHVLVNKRVPLPLQTSGACVDIQNIYESSALVRCELSPPSICVLKKIQTGLFRDGDVVERLYRDATLEAPLREVKRVPYTNARR